VALVVAPGAGVSEPLAGLSICTTWTTEDDVRTLNPSLAGDLTIPIGWASEWLFNVSGRQWAGICTDTVRPTCPCAGRCEGVSEVTLGGYPLVSVEQVLIDGAVLDPARYRVDDHVRLVRLADADGTRRRWPCRQRMDLPTTEPNTWQVSLTYGAMPPYGGQAAATVLAAELALALRNDGACRLPRKTQQVARQGVTLMVYPANMMAGGKTGIAEIDGWVGTVNPAGLRARATVHTPGRGRRGVRRPGA
jgi:hypothetical protein